jgi:hypothetical protein
MKKVALFSLVLFCACEGILSPVNLDEPFFLNFGGSKVLRPDNLRIEFQQVLEESRCPSDAVCIWAGRARIGLLLQTTADSVRLELVIPGFVAQSDTLAHQPVDTIGYRITLLQLDPYPHSQRQAPDSEYRALLKISRLMRR